MRSSPKLTSKSRSGTKRRASAVAPWEDVDSYLLGSLPAGKEVRLALSSSETLKLYEELRHLYELAEIGVPAGSRRYRFVDADLADILDGREREALEAIIARSGDMFPKLLGSVAGADLIALAAREREHGRRVEAVREMEAHIDGGHDWTELQWKAFFEANRWIFGHGLDYRFLTSVEDEAYYGGMEVSGKGAQRGDNLYRSEADVHFTVLVEIKRPDAGLVTQRPYRNGVYSPGPDLAGGVAQVQTNCRTWAVEGSTTKANQRRLDADKTYTIEPKGILLIGHLGNLGGEPAWVEAFEQYRRNLHNPEILTFDELLARATFIVETVAARAEEVAAAIETERLAEQDADDVEASAPIYEGGYDIPI